MDPRSRFTRAASCAALCFVIAAALSCRANPVSKTRLKGPATLEIAVGGVLPPSRASRSARFVPGVSPAIVPATATIRVVVEDDGGDRTTASSAYSGAGTVRVDDLPAGEELSIEVAALDADGDAVTSWTGTETLERGNNTLAATLAPASVIELPTRTVSLGAETLQASVTLDAGGAVFYRIPLDCSAGGEYQILYDTGKARWAWMGVYDDSWLPLEVVCSDQSQGWAVVAVPAGATTTVNIALANTVASPGYPAGSMTGALQTRHAVFVSPDGSGTGTSDDPTGAFDSLADGQSAFIRDGDYALSYTYTATAGIHLYGGFGSGWSSRDGTSFISLSSEASDTMSFEGSSSGRVDGITIHGNEWTAGMDSAVGLTVNTTGSLVVSNCVIEGNTSAAALSGNKVLTALYIAAGTSEISSCTIRSGTISTSNGTAVEYAVRITGGTPYIHNCSIDGGTASTDDIAAMDASTCGILIEGGSAIVAGCRVWGGIASSDLATGRTYGVNCVTADGGTAIVGSIVSGGRASAENAFATGVCKTEYDAVIAGCVIDSGSATAAGARTAYGVDFHLNDAASGTLAANAVFCSAASGTDVVAALYDYYPGDGETVTGNGVFSCDSEAFTWGEGSDFLAALQSSYPDYYSGNVANSARLPAQEFRSYSAAPTTFAEFLAVDWRPASGSSIVGTASGGSPQSVGVDPTLFTAYPALGFDLAGTPRGYSTGWSRGAYQ